MRVLVCLWWARSLSTSRSLNEPPWQRLMLEKCATRATPLRDTNCVSSFGHRLIEFQFPHEHLLSRHLVNDAQREILFRFSPPPRLFRFFLLACVMMEQEWLTKNKPHWTIEIIILFFVNAWRSVKPKLFRWGLEWCSIQFAHIAF